MWKTTGVSSAAILYMLGIISSRPWEAVKVVVSAPACNAPWMAPAAPPSLCISTMRGTVPHRLVGVDGNHLVQLVGHPGRCLAAVDGHLALFFHGVLPSLLSLNEYSMSADRPIGSVQSR